MAKKYKYNKPLKNCKHDWIMKPPFPFGITSIFFNWCQTCGMFKVRNPLTKKWEYSKPKNINKLNYYLQHTGMCDIWIELNKKPSERNCTCGLKELLK